MGEGEPVSADMKRSMMTLTRAVSGQSGNQIEKSHTESEKVNNSSIILLAPHFSLSVNGWIN